MNRYPLWRYLLLAALIVLGIIYALPNLYQSDPSLQISYNDPGLSVTDAVQSSSKNILQGAQIPYISITRNDRAVIVRFHNTNDQLKAREALEAHLGKNFTIAVNLLSRTPHFLTMLGAEPMKYGLDLQGGIHFLFEVDAASMLKARQKGDVHGITLALREKNVRYSSIDNQSTGIHISFRDQSALINAEKVIKGQYPDYTLKANGNILIASMSPEVIQKISQAALTQNLVTLKKRVDELGVAEASIVQQGANQISVDLPGIQDSARAQNLIGKMATLSFQLVDDSADLQGAANGDITFGSRMYHFKDGRPILLKTQAILEGRNIVSATSAADENGKPAVSIRLGSGEALFHRITGEHIGQRLAVVYEETKTHNVVENGHVIQKSTKEQYVISAPVIQSALPSSFQITNLDSQAEANNLSLLLRSGSLSAPMRIIQSQIVGPSLGRANIEKGVLSVVIGSLVVIAFMLVYYRLFGLVANIALILNIVFIVAALSVLGATLTLPGIAAIVLTVGMAVDANVLINERIREEIRNNNSPQAAIHAGYARAFATIVDANVTTLIVALVLVALGTGSVKGFAIALIIGLIASMITAIFFTRAVINLIYGRRTTIKALSIGIRPPTSNARG